MPLLLAGVHCVFGDGHASVVAVLLLQCLAHVLIAVLVCAVAAIWLPAWAACVAGCIAGLDMDLTHWSADYYHLDQRYSLSVVAMLLALGTLVRAWNRPRPPFGRLVIAGAVFGLANLCEATLLPFTVLAGAGLACHPRWSRPSWRAALVFAGSAGVVLAPWLIRNALVFRTWPLLRSSSGLLFWVGNNPMATGLWADQELMDDPERQPQPRGALLLGGHATSFNFRAAATLPPAVRAELAADDEVGRDRVLWRAGLDWVRAHPARFAALTWQRAKDLAGGPVGTRPRRLWKTAAFLAALLASLTVRFRGAKWIAALLVSWWAVFAVTHCGYNVYREMLDPFIVLSLTLGAVELVRAWRRRAARRRAGRVAVELG